MSRISSELCLTDYDALEFANNYGVDGIEICSDLSCGGLTPSIGLVKKCTENFKGEISVLIRPRKGDFIYSKVEKSIIFEDISAFQDLGVYCFVIGALVDGNAIDETFLYELREEFGYQTKLCFHRAFEAVPDVEEAMRILKKYKVQRLLCSGRNKSPMEDAIHFKRLMELSSGEPQIIAGGGIRAIGLVDFLKETSVDRVHFSPIPKSDSNQQNSREIPHYDTFVSILDAIHLASI